MNDTKCSVCGDSLYEENLKETIIGLNIRLILRDKILHKEFEKVKDMFGTTEFNICYCCWLKSLGVKPLEK
jgi:hypothetical protein